jgi:hypothetical protein
MHLVAAGKGKNEELHRPGIEPGASRNWDGNG